ncbi:MAG: glycosyltransferase [Luteitalea sp.]|nr:glycosyltransferase [Luteitalea sp.]
MRVLFLVQHTGSSPGTRYRVLQYLPALESAGFLCTVRVAQSQVSTAAALGSLGRARHVRTLQLARSWSETHASLARLISLLPRFDRCVFYRIPLPAWTTTWLGPYRDRLVYDFDDALDVQEAGETHLMAKLRGRLWRDSLARAIACCRVIVTSNHRNAAVVQAAGGEAVLIPTSVDIDRYPFPAPPRTAARLVLGWIGTPSTAAYLTLIEEPLRRILCRYDVELRLVGAGRSPLRGVPVTIHPWCLETEVNDVSAFDIGLMPMPDTAWTRGKAALKALQYGASGAPTIASWTETNEQILGSDTGTLFCRSDAEWERALAQLIEDRTLREQLGRRARDRVASLYSVQANAPKWIALLRKAEKVGS